MKTDGSGARARMRPRVVGVVMVAMVAASCGSDDGGSAGTDATDPPAAEDVLGTPAPATGEPILVGTINEAGSDPIDQQAETTLKGINIAADYANEYLGGVAGHPIEIVSCGNRGTPAGATDCANQMVEQQIDIYIAPYSGEEAVIIPILAAADIPVVQTSAATQEALQTPGVYVAAGGFPAFLGGFAVKAEEEGVTKFAMITIDVPTATGGAEQLGGIAFGTVGVDFEVVPVAPGTPDMSPQLQAAIEGGADALGVTGDGAFCASFMQAYQTLGLTVPKYIIPTCIEESVIAAAPAALDGSNVALLRGPGPDDAVYAATVEEYGDGVDPDPNISSAEADGWVAVMNVVNIMSGYTGPIDPDSVRTQIEAAVDFEVPLSGELTGTCDGTAIPIIPNVCSGEVQMAVVDAEGGLSGYERVDSAEAYAES